MRRLGMKNKHRKSEAASDSEPEENVDARAGNDDDDGTQAGKNNSAQKSATKRRSARGSSVQKPAVNTNDDDDSDNDDSAAVEPKERENGEKRSSLNKRRKKEDQRASTSARDKSEDAESEYEVERLMNVRTIKGRRQFLVRWVGYGDTDDTWENEKDLNCPQLIEDFLIEEKEKEKESKPQKLAKTDKPKKSSKSTSKKHIQETKETDEEDSTEEKGISKEFEVERVIEVRFKKNGSKEFLIRWKGFSASDDTWEPEKNLNCPELIGKFMEKLEKAKTSEMRELRTNRVHTKRYTLSTHDRGRRLSKRNKDKQRATYHECDE